MKISTSFFVYTILKVGESKPCPFQVLQSHWQRIGSFLNIINRFYIVIQLASLIIQNNYSTTYLKEMNTTLPQSPQVLAHRSGISSQYDIVHPLSLSSHSESIFKILKRRKLFQNQEQKIIFIRDLYYKTHFQHLVFHRYSNGVPLLGFRKIYSQSKICCHTS